MYECNPLSFIIEQAGGMATDGQTRIMELEPDSKHNVQKVMDFLQEFAAVEA